MFDSGFHAGYEYGIKGARRASPLLLSQYLDVTPNSAKGLSKAIVKVMTRMRIKRIQANEALER